MRINIHTSGIVKRDQETARGRNNTTTEEKKCHTEIECSILRDVLIGKGNENITR